MFADFYYEQSVAFEMAKPSYVRCPNGKELKILFAVYVGPSCSYQKDPGGSVTSWILLSSVRCSQVSEDALRFPG